MDRIRIAVIVGSLRRASLNRRLAAMVATLAPADFELAPVEIGDLPLFNEDDEERPVESVKRLRADIASAQGLLFVTAEYNRSIPGVLKNAIDHASRPFGHSAWTGKPAGMLGVSVSAMGTSMAQQHLRNVLASLDVPTLGQPEAFIHAKDDAFDDPDGTGPGIGRFLQTWMNAYVAWVRRHNA